MDFWFGEEERKGLRKGREMMEIKGRGENFDSPKSFLNSAACDDISNDVDVFLDFEL